MQRLPVFMNLYLNLMLTGLYLMCIMAVDKHFFIVKLMNEPTQRRHVWTLIQVHRV